MIKTTDISYKILKLILHEQIYYYVGTLYLVQNDLHRKSFLHVIQIIVSLFNFKSIATMLRESKHMITFISTNQHDLSMLFNNVFTILSIY